MFINSNCDSEWSREQEALEIAQSIIRNSYSKSNRNALFAINQASKRTAIPEARVEELLSSVQWEIKQIFFIL